MNLLQATKLATALAVASATGKTELPDLIRAGLAVCGVENLQIHIVPASETVHCTMKANGGPLHREITFAQIEEAFNEPPGG